MTNHMKKHFYTHLVEIETIYTELEALPMHKHEKDELVEIVHSTIHHVVIDTVLSELPEEDKKTFLSHVHAENHDSIWGLLKEKIEKSEEKIKQAVEQLKKDFHQDIDEIKKGKS